MKFWFSGIKCNGDANLLHQAGVRRVLVNPQHVHFAAGFERIGLDSGAWLHFRHGGKVNVEQYLEFAMSGNFIWCSAPDVIGDAEQTFQNWLTAKRWIKSNFGKAPTPMIPVWGWGSPTEHLETYLQHHRIVGIGGLVPLMRLGKSHLEHERTQAIAMLRQLVALCQQYPQRFHIYGINWTWAINQLKGLAYSGDSSLWLDGARYRKLIHLNPAKTGLCRSAARDIGFRGQDCSLMKKFDILQPTVVSSGCIYDSQGFHAHSSPCSSQ